MNINLIQMLGTQASSTASKSGTNGLSSTDKSGFMSLLSNMISEAETPAISTQTTGVITDKNILFMAVNIASELKEQGLLPESMENISLKDLTQGIYDLMKGADLPSDISALDITQLTLKLQSVVDNSSTTDASSNSKKDDEALFTDIAAVMAYDQGVNSDDDTLNISTDAETINNAATKTPEDIILDIISKNNGDAEDSSIIESDDTDNSSQKTVNVNVAINSGKDAEEQVTTDVQISSDDIINALYNAPKEVISANSKQPVQNDVDVIIDNLYDSDVTEFVITPEVNNSKAVSKSSDETIENDIATLLMSYSSTAPDDVSSTASEELPINNQFIKSNTSKQSSLNVAADSAQTASDDAELDALLNSYTAQSSDSDDSEEFALHSYIASTSTKAAKNNESAETAANKGLDLSAKITGMGTSKDAINSVSSGSSNFNQSFADLYQESGSKLYDLDSSNITTSMGASSTDQSFTNYFTALKDTNTAYSTSTTQMVALQLQQNANNQVSKMKLQLVPEELGKLDIELKFGKDGSIKARLTAEKSETLSMLQKDSSQLQKVLQEAGFDVNQDSLSFDLQQNSQQDFASANGNQGKYNNDNFLSTLDGDIVMDNAIQAQIAIEAMGYANSYGVNITV